ncbi:class I SAM-dependent methyltransferase [Bacillus sp. A116_S68]|nr:class I SAM-dependent methyltransferase [Bacillus sp. A116_S68]
MDLQEATMTETIYNVLDQGAEIVKSEKDILYLEALSYMGEMMFNRRTDESLQSSEKLDKLLSDLPDKGVKTRENYRRAMQLAVLKGMREATQPHHAMTPDAVSIFIGYIANKVLSHDDKTKHVVMDPAVGAGNLMTAVLNQLEKEALFVGVDPDETLLKLAYANANLQTHDVELFHQDSVSNPLIKEVDLVVSDLPAGYYPNDTTAEKFVTKADDGHSFVHHLLIEQGVKHVKKGGFLIFLVPNSLFQSEQSKQLHTFIKQEAIIYSFMQLPSSMFKNQAVAKSILVLRKQSEGIVAPKQALLAELPSFSQEGSLADMMGRISTWFDDHLKRDH